MKTIPQEFEQVMKTARHLATHRDYAPIQVWKTIKEVEKLQSREYLSGERPVQSCLKNALKQYEEALQAIGDPMRYHASEIKASMDMAANAIEQAYRIYAAKINEDTTKQEYGNYSQSPMNNHLASEGEPLPSIDFNIVLAEKNNPPQAYQESGIVVSNPRPANYGSGWEAWIVKSSEPMTIYIVGRIKNPFSTRPDVETFVREFYPYMTYYSSQIDFANAMINRQVSTKSIKSARKDMMTLVYQILMTMRNDPVAANNIINVLLEVQKYNRQLEHIIEGRKEAIFFVQYLGLLIQTLLTRKDVFNDEIDQLEDYMSYCQSHPHVTINNDRNIQGLDNLIQDITEAANKVTSKAFSMKQMAVPISSNAPIDYEFNDNYVGEDMYAARDGQIGPIFHTLRGELIQLLKTIEDNRTDSASILQSIYQIAALMSSVLISGSSFLSDSEKFELQKNLNNLVSYENVLEQSSGNLIPNYFYANLSEFLSDQINAVNAWLSTINPQVKFMMYIPDVMPEKIVSFFAGAVRTVIKGITKIFEFLYNVVSKVKIKHIVKLLQIVLSAVSFITSGIGQSLLSLAGDDVPDSNNFINPEDVNKIIAQLQRMDQDMGIPPELIHQMVQILTLKSKSWINEYCNDPVKILDGIVRGYIIQKKLADDVRTQKLQAVNVPDVPVLAY